MPAEAPSRVSLLLIGTELLTAKVSDTNGPYCVRVLSERGVTLQQIRVIRDEVDEIVASLRDLRRGADFVITSGGIGPTHDDLTLRAVAQALEVPVVRDATLVQHIERLFGRDPHTLDVWGRMADVPSGTSFETMMGGHWPIYRVENVFMLPGVPQLFELQLDHIAPHFDGAPNHTATLYVSVGEGAIALPLTEASERFVGLEFGSYPVWGNARFRTRLTIEGRSSAGVRAAAEWLVDAVGRDVVVEVTYDERELRG